MELHFIRPYWFIAVIPAVIVCWRLSKISLADNWRSICDAHLLTHLLILPKHRAKSGIILLSIGCLLTILALSGPSFSKQVQPVYRTELGNVLVLNLSPSMSDFLGTTKKIDRARYKMLDYLTRLKEGQTGLVIYTDEAHTLSPLTEDNHTIANFVPALDPSIMPTYSDDTAIGLDEGSKLLQQAGLHKGNIILLTDKITHYAATKRIVKLLNQQGYHLYILSFANQAASEQAMADLAKLGGGKLISLTPNNHDVNELLANTKQKKLAAAKKSQQKGLVWQDNGRLFVLLLLPLALLAFRRGFL